MKVLFLTSRFPYPLDRGDRLRTYHFLREIASEHEVKLLSFIESGEEQQQVGVLESLGISTEVVHLPRWRSLISMAAAAPSSVPFQIGYYLSHRMRSLVARYAPDYDVTIAFHVRMTPYLTAVPSSTMRIADLCDCVSSEYLASLAHRQGIAKLFYREEARRVRACEKQLLSWVDEVWMISEAEVKKLAGKVTSVQVVPNGVPSAPPEAVSSSRRSNPGSQVIFTGNLSVPHNIDAARFLATKVFPRVTAEIPNAKLIIAGADVTRPVRDLEGPNVTVAGYVDDLLGLLVTGDVFAAPMRYVAGVQNKVLEAMACGLPVVTSLLVCQGVAGIPGTHLLVAEDERFFASAIVRLLKDRELANRIGDSGRELVLSHFNWSAVLDRLAIIEHSRESILTAHGTAHGS